MLLDGADNVRCALLNLLVLGRLALALVVQRIVLAGKSGEQFALLDDLVRLGQRRLCAPLDALLCRDDLVQSCHDMLLLTLCAMRPRVWPTQPDMAKTRVIPRGTIMLKL